MTSPKTKNKTLSTYLFGFNGMEKDDEVKGGGNSYDFGARIYDSRLGRWLTIDPKWKLLQMVSPYSYAKNDPINKIDIAGEVIAGANQKSFERLQNHINTVFAGKDNAALRGLFKQQEGAFNFTSISEQEFMDAVSSIKDPDVRALANAYYEAVNSTVTYKLLLVHNEKKVKDEDGYKGIKNKDLDKQIGEETGNGVKMSKGGGGNVLVSKDGGDVVILLNEDMSTQTTLVNLTGPSLSTTRNGEAAITGGILHGMFLQPDPFIAKGGYKGVHSGELDWFLQDSFENITNRILGNPQTSMHPYPGDDEREKSTTIPGELEEGNTVYGNTRFLD